MNNNPYQRNQNLSKEDKERQDFFNKIKRLFGKKAVIVQRTSQTKSGKKIVKVKDIDTYTNKKQGFDSLASSKGFSKIKRGSLSNTGGIGDRMNMTSRRMLYTIYASMESGPENSTALTVYADECTTKNEYGDVLEIKSSDKTITKILENLYYDIFNIDFNLRAWTRNTCKYGDMGVALKVEPDMGIIDYIQISPWEFERIEDDPKYEDDVIFEVESQQTDKSAFYNFEFLHFRLMDDTQFLPYGKSILEPARTIWRQIIIMEDAMLVYRITRAPDRIVYKIDVGNLPPKDIESYMQQAREELKSDFNVDVNISPMQFDHRFSSMSPIEDFFIPVSGDKSGTEIETLSGGGNEGAIEDIEYMQNKLFISLGVPKVFLGHTEDLDGKTSASAIDVRFSRTIQRIQQILVAELKKAGIIHLYALGFTDSDLLDFELKLTIPSSVAEQQKLDLMNSRADTFNSMVTQASGVSLRKAYEDVYGIEGEEFEEAINEMIEGAKIMHRLRMIEDEGNDPERSQEVADDMENNKFGGRTDTEIEADEVADDGSSELDDVGDREVSPNALLRQDLRKHFDKKNKNLILR